MPAVLFAPLNWGLGHATRSLPLATALERAAADVGLDLDMHWASDGDAAELLRRERPGDTHHPLPGYGVRYPTRSATLNMALSGPRMLLAVGGETTATRALHAEHGFGLVVSDNRYGCRVPGVRSLFVTHQCHLPTGGLAGRVAQGLHEAWLGGFDEILVPDFGSAPRLAGEMSAPLPRVPCRYLEPVSRFTGGTGGELVVAPVDRSGQVAAGGASAGPPGPYETVCLLSGPEPTRTQLEETLYWALPHPERTLLIRGTTAVRPRPPAPPELTIRDVLTAGELKPVLAQAPRIITRPGYTTVMDLAALGRSAVFVPTPAQPEQARLADGLTAGGFGVALSQDELRRVPGVLAKALQQLASMTYGSPQGALSRKPTQDALRQWARDEVSRLH